MSYGMNLFLPVLLILIIKRVQSDLVDLNGKSSLTFVIDDTGSMHNVIAQVKEGAKSIFDTVINSNSSQIEDFVLVTFNDPTTKHRITTNRFDVFKRAIDSIIVRGGGDCPEMCMTGIEKALIESRPGSLLYIFTDASAKDYTDYEKVKALAQKKRSQIVFVLTGMCDTENDPKYKVFEDLAAATSGQVFHLDRSGEVLKVLKYVEESVKSRKTVIANKDFPPGPNTFTYEVDGKMKELVISVAGRKPSVTVTGPDGKPTETEDVIRTSTIAVVKVTEVKPGVYSAEVNSMSRTSVVVTGTTTVHFQYGFAQKKPSSVASTATRPVPDVKSFVAIKLITDGGNITLQTLQIRDMYDNIITEVPFAVTADKKNQFYVTDKIDLPKTTFRIAIKGYDTESKTAITRISLTPIEPQIIVEGVNTPPKLIVVGEAKVTVEYDHLLELKCRVNAYPKPTVTWEDNDGNSLPADINVVELPSDFLSVLTLDSVKENKTYMCKAKNDYGEDGKNIVVETTRTFYLQVLEAPKSADIEINTKAKFICKVDAKPPASIQWFKANRPLKSDEYIGISPDNSELIINNMLPEHTGRYMCSVRNTYENRALWFHVGISGTEPPVIDKKTNEIRAVEGADIDIGCRLLHGKPKPTIRWFFQNTPEEIKEIDAAGEDNIILHNVTTEMSGTYRCKARNDVGDDYHYIDVVVEFPPVIRRGKREIIARENDKIKIPCRVEGEPAPEVRWFINDTKIDNKRFSIHKTHSLYFRANLNDSGIYRCQAINDHGIANAVTQVLVITPSKIETPDESRLEVKVGSNIILPCVADGFPKPHIKWTFYRSNPKIAPRELKTRDPSGSLSLRAMQLNKEGYYTCEATNIGGTTKITYEVIVLAPPQIKNTYPEKTFKAVVGDRVVRIRCEATGNPKPDITWVQEEIGKIPSESEWYDIDKDGTLIIKNIDKDSAGNYMCQAQNPLGIDSKNFYVAVDPYPIPDTPTLTVLIEEGHSSDVTCKIPHTKTDSLRWFKDGKLIAINELRLENVKTSDSGTYTCRVSTFEKARNANVEVRVGYKPRFLYPDDKHIEFEEGLVAVMDCNAEGSPEPEVSWWHNGKRIPIDGMTYTFNMKVSDIGKYTCYVKNSFGSKIRQYEISSRDCMLHINDDFDTLQPLMVSKLPDNLTWPMFERMGEYVRIPTGEQILLSCPSGFENYPVNDVMVRCTQNKKFYYDGDTYAFKKFQCRREQVPILRRTGETCSSGDTEKIEVGYEVFGEFLEVYNVCFDRVNHVPLYVEHNINRYIADVKLKREKWYTNEITPFDFESMYNCRNQLRVIGMSLGTRFPPDERCCFSERPLVNSRDVLPGLSQTATYSRINMVPQWSSCNSKNWDHIEQLVRNLAKSSSGQFKVWTGRSQNLIASGNDLSIMDQYGKQQPVPRFLWKVVKDLDTKESVAIIHVNVPYLTYSDAASYIRCRDVCNEIEWIGRRSWRDVTDGFIYCCNIKEFERNFGYHDIFNSGDGKLLYRSATSALPEFSFLG